MSVWNVALVVGSCCDLIDTLHVILLHILTNTVGSGLIVAGFRVLPGKLCVVVKIVGVQDTLSGFAVSVFLLVVKQRLLQPTQDLLALAML
jgi:hypothetical protein